MVASCLGERLDDAARSRRSATGRLVKTVNAVDRWERCIRSSPAAIVRPERCSPSLSSVAAFAAVRSVRDARPADRPAGQPQRRRPGPWPLPASPEMPSGRPMRTGRFEDAGGKLRQSGQLACAAGQNRAGARLVRERRSRQAVSDHFENLLDPRLDDAHQTRTRHELGRLAVVVIDRRHRNHVALVRSSREHAAVERFDSFCIRDTSVQARVPSPSSRDCRRARSRRQWTKRPPENTATVVVPAPMSIRAAPMSASSSAITREAGDIGRRHHGLDLRDGSARPPASGCAPPPRRRSPHACRR